VAHFFDLFQKVLEMFNMAPLHPTHCPGREHKKFKPGIRPIRGKTSNIGLCYLSS